MLIQQPDVIEALQRMLGAIVRRGKSIDVHAPLAAAGLSSMMAAQLWVEVDATFGVDMPLSWLAGEMTLAELAARIAEGDYEDQRATRQVIPDPAARHEPFALTALQQAYVAGTYPELTDDPVGCQQYQELEIADVDPQRLQSAWRQLVEHHDMLRTIITPEGNQRLGLDLPPWTMPVHDLSAMGAREAEAAVAAVRARLSKRCYQPGTWPRFAVELSLRPGAPTLVHLSLDSAACDGHSTELLLAQLAACYRRPDEPLPRGDLSARDCVQAMVLDREDATHQRDLAYWVDRLIDLPDGPRLTSPNGTADSERRGLTGRLSAPQYAGLSDRAAMSGVSPSSLVLSVFADALARAGARSPFSLVIATSARTWLPAEAADLVGPFTCTAVVVADVAPDGPATASAPALHQQVWAALDHPTVCCVDALRELRARDEGVPGALPVVFTSMLGQERGAGDPLGFPVDATYATSQTSDVLLDHQIWERDGELHFRWDIVTARTADERLESAFAHFINGLNGACTDAHELPSLPSNALQQAYLVARSAAGGESWNG